VRRAEDIHELRGLIPKSLLVVAKIEKDQALDNITEILLATDAVMVARGDLGVELPFENVPQAQKRIIALANRMGRPVITATQMLESMVEHPRPTRAEASDVANAIMDGTDAVMLSAETATGQYPVLAVATMARIVETAENGRPTGSSDITRWAGKQSGRISRALCEAAAFAAHEIGNKTIAVITESGLMAHRLSALRPEQRIIALTPNAGVQNELSLLWGTEAYVHPPSSSTKEMLKACERVLLEVGAAQPGETVVMMAGRLSGLGLSSSVTIYTIGGEAPRDV